MKAFVSAMASPLYLSLFWRSNALPATLHRASAFCGIPIHLGDHLFHFRMLGGLLLDHEEQCCFDQALFRISGGDSYFFRLRSKFRILIFDHFQESGMHFSHVRAAPGPAGRRGIGGSGLQG